MNGTLAMVLLDVADQASVSVIIPPGADTQTVTLDLNDVPAQQVFQRVGDIIEATANYDGTTVSFTFDDDQADAYTVFRVGHSDPSQVVEAVRAVTGTGAVVSTFGDRIVVSGNERSVKRADTLAQHFNSGPDGWRLEVRLVSISETLRRELGIDWDIQGTLDIGITASTGDLAPPILSGLAAGALVRIIAEASELGTDAFIESSATLYVLEGGTGTINQGDRVPVPRFQTSPEGTTTIVGYDYIETGFVLTANAKRVPGGVRLLIEPVISTVTGFVEQAPITTESRVSVDAVVNDGSWLIVSGLTTSQGSNVGSRLPGTKSPLFGSDETNTTTTSLVVLLRADRVYASSP